MVFFEKLYCPTVKKSNDFPRISIVAQLRLQKVTIRAEYILAKELESELK